MYLMKGRFALVTVCLCLAGLQETRALEQSDGVYRIGNAVDLIDFAGLVNGGLNAAQAVITDDIDLSGSSFTPIGNTLVPFRGSIDGQGHTISNYYYESKADAEGFIGLLHGGTVENLTVEGTLVARNGATGLVGFADGNAVVRNVVSRINVDCQNTGHCGGVVGSLRQAHIDRCTYEGVFEIQDGIKGDSDGGVAGYTNTGRITNCLFAGTIKANGSNNLGGILGYVNNGSFQGLDNNLSVGTFEVASPSATTAAVLGHANSSTPKNKLNNNYYREGCGLESGMKGSQAVATTCVNDEQLASGEVAYCLNKGNETPVWMQEIGVDKRPTLQGDKVVYANGTLNCDGTPKDDLVYSNTCEELKQDPHLFDEELGVCSTCGQFEKDADGYVLVRSGKALRLVAERVNGGQTEMNLRFVADLDLSDGDWTPIGNDTKIFRGNVDGQGHTISGMKVDWYEPGAGLFGTVSAGNFSDIVIDASCSVTGIKYSGGLIGHSYGSGTVNITRVGVECNVTCNGEAAAGLIGNANSGSQCNITSCYTTGEITATQDAAAFSAWEGNVGATIKDSWSIAVVTNYQDEAHYLARYGGLKLTGCYCPYGTQGTHIEPEDVQSGRLAWLLNGGKISDALWHQTVGEDLYPVLDASHGIVYSSGDKYGSINDDASLETFRNDVVAEEKAYLNDVIACQAVIDAYSGLLDEFAAIKEKDASIEAYEQVMEERKTVEASAAAYSSYIQACEDIMEYLGENEFAGSVREKLETYLNDEVEPGDDYPNGSHSYIVEHHTLTDEQIEAEKAYVEELLKLAISTGYTAGAEITSLLANPTLADGFEGWDRTFVGESMTAGGVKELMPAAEAWNCTFEMMQTLTGLTNGIYMLQANAAFRPAGDYLSTLHGAILRAGGNVNFVMVEGEDVLPIENAEDGVNCHLTGEWTDRHFINDEVDGYVPVGPLGCSYAFASGRYLNSVAVEVTDGTLTVGIANPGTGMKNDWTGMGNFRLFYLGNANEATERLGEVLEGYAGRARTILDFVWSDAEDFSLYPNMSEDLKKQLSQALAETGSATDGAARLALANRFSDLFLQVADCRKAYVEMVSTASGVEVSLDQMFTLGLVSEQDRDRVYEMVESAWEHYAAGDISADEARQITESMNNSNIYPPMADGYYMLGTPEHLLLFAFMVNTGMTNINGKLTADIDMDGVEFTPIGWNMDNDCQTTNDTYVFRGTFDGLGHTISNLAINKPKSIGVGFFGNIASPATIKDLRLDNTCAIVGYDRAGLVGRSTGGGDIYLERLGNEGTVTSGIAAAGILGNANSGSVAHLADCYSTGDIIQVDGIAQGKDCAQICGWFGAVGATLDNCWSTSSVNGYQDIDHLFCRHSNNMTVFNNCYSLYGNGTQAKIVSKEEVSNGTLTWNLNGGLTENPVWRQNLGNDPHPVLDATHAIVEKDEDGSFVNAGDETDVAKVEGSEATATVTDMQGRTLRTSVDATRATQGLPKGIYFVKRNNKVTKVLVR